LRGRHLVSGFLLGLACTIRPDAVLYAASLGALLWQSGARLRLLLGCAGAFVVGALPLFAYNTATRGHPFAFTQASEFNELLGALVGPLFGPRAAYAQAITVDSGGAFRLANLSRTLPENVRLLVRPFGWLGLLTLAGIAWGARARPALVATLVPYPL